MTVAVFVAPDLKSSSALYRSPFDLPASAGTSLVLRPSKPWQAAQLAAQYRARSSMLCAAAGCAAAASTSSAIAGTPFLSVIVLLLVLDRAQGCRSAVAHTRCGDPRRTLTPAALWWQGRRHGHRSRKKRSGRQRPLALPREI